MKGEKEERKENALDSRRAKEGSQGSPVLAKVKEERERGGKESWRVRRKEERWENILESRAKRRTESCFGHREEGRKTERRKAETEERRKQEGEKGRNAVLGMDTRQESRKRMWGFPEAKIRTHGMWIVEP